MIPVTTLLMLLFIHCVFDWGLQTNWQAQNKSKSLTALFRHVAIYSLPFFWWGWRFGLVTFTLHLVTDCLTSEQTRRNWFVGPRASLARQGDRAEDWGAPVYVPRYFPKKRKAFFLWIGADQLVHQVSLILTYVWLGS